MAAPCWAKACGATATAVAAAPVARMLRRNESMVPPLEVVRNEPRRAFFSISARWCRWAQCLVVASFEYGSASVSRRLLARRASPGQPDASGFPGLSLPAGSATIAARLRTREDHHVED